ncbi:tyrosine-protein phosphatase [Albimonas sp. CAU 1670]|uniref:tyrosine-protein phosphatase n=1 Tax=Albimonas sp. CAU 1670 TaxID=3032599 RepID=UPI0023DA4518|nr:tyrosine-protein phosphatase [Albimonas sp. CAU 1670]MDF2233005.1 tyrosine-protein phosphatase [Albimonas sp. CAU 1670]
MTDPDAPQPSARPDPLRPDPLRPDAVMAPPKTAKEAKRQARRLRAQERWETSLESPRARLRAWLDMLFVDHGVIRAVYLNLHPVGPDAFRAAQPLPGQIARLARRSGLKAVISLRGGVLHGSYPLEREVCEAEGLVFTRAVLRSRGLPSREEFAALETLIAETPTPVLFHCKSGADRAGFMAALWMILHEGRSAAEAAGQLSLRYGHLSHGPTGVLDRFFAEAVAAEARGVPFRVWIETEYDREAIETAHRAQGRRGLVERISGWITDRLLRRE